MMSSVNCNIPSAATESSIFAMNNQCLLISCTPKTHVLFHQSLELTLQFAFENAQKTKSKCHCLQTAAPNVTTSQFRHELPRLVTWPMKLKSATSCSHQKGVSSLSDLRTVLITNSIHLLELHFPWLPNASQSLLKKR